MNRIIYLIILIPILFGCSLDLDNLLTSSTSDDEEVSVVYRDEFDTDTNTRYYYKDDVLQWMEYHDFDTEDNCIMIKRVTTSETTLFTKLYSWDADLLSQVSTFGPKDSIQSSSTYEYNADGDIIQINNYGSSNEIVSITTYSYTDDTVTDTRNYDESYNLVWAYLHDLGSDGEFAESRYYDGTTLAGYNTYEYKTITYLEEALSDYADLDIDISDYISVAIGYGDTTSSTTFISNPSSPSFKTPGDQEITSRNSAGLVSPTLTEPDDITEDSLSSSGNLDYTWMKLCEYDDYGESKTLLNDEYKPTYISRSIPDYDEPLEIELDYDSDGYLQSKTTSYDGNDLLTIEVSSVNSTYSMDITGSIMPLPVELDLTLSDDDIPQQIDISSSGVVLQYFVYDFEEPEDGLTLDNFMDSIATIKQYNGSDILVGTYTFSYVDDNNDELGLTINVTDSDGEYTGKFELGYDSSGNNTYLKSYDDKDNVIWNYTYEFEEVVDDVVTMVSEVNLDEDDIPTVLTDFDYMSIITDITSYLPFDI